MRDHKGDPVRDLTQADFEIYEDGARQDLGSFTPIFLEQQSARRWRGSGHVQPSPSSALPAPSAEASHRQGAGDDRARLRSADRRLADAGVPGRDEVPGRPAGVEQLHGGLRHRHQADSDAELHARHLAHQEGDRHVRQPQHLAVRIEPRGDSEGRRTAEPGGRSDRDGEPGGGGGRAGGGPGRGTDGGRCRGRAVPGDGSVDDADASMRSSATRPALRARTRCWPSSTGCAAIPGRKSIVFFSEGLSIPPNVYEQFRSVIDAANRANVSIYPMDAMGLRAESTVAQVRDEINQEGKANTRRTGADGAGARHERRPRAQRGPPSNGSELRPRRPRREDRRLPHLEHERSAGWVLAHRIGHAQLLPADLRADERQLRRQVPPDQRQGEARRRERPLAQGVLRRPRGARRARADVRGGGDGRARPHARAERVPGARLGRCVSPRRIIRRCCRSSSSLAPTS